MNEQNRQGNGTVHEIGRERQSQVQAKQHRVASPATQFDGDVKRNIVAGFELDLLTIGILLGELPRFGHLDIGSH